MAVEGAEVETRTVEMARWCRARFDNKHHNNSRRFHTNHIESSNDLKILLKHMWSKDRIAPLEPDNLSSV